MKMDQRCPLAVGGFPLDLEAMPKFPLNLEERTFEEFRFALMVHHPLLPMFLLWEYRE